MYLLSHTTAKGNVLSNSIRTRVITALLTALLVGCIGTQSSVADEINHDDDVSQITSITSSLKEKNLRQESNSEKVSGPALSQSSNISSVTVSSISTDSIIDSLKWACKVTLTLVGIGAWITTVYYSGGILLTVSNWVIRYVTVPSLLCNWL